MAVAVRHKSGEVVIHTEPLDGLYYRKSWARRPFIRGVMLLANSLSIGLRSLVYSVNLALGAKEGEEKGQRTSDESSPLREEEVTGQSEVAAREAFGGGLMWGTLATSLVLSISLFFVLPLLVTRALEAALTLTATQSAMIEGGIRVAIVLAYLWLIGRLPAVREVFAYHGAEHKAINAYEAGEPMTAERVARYSVAHPRCGTSFLLYVVVVSAFVFALLGRPPLAVRVASRVVLVPVIASVAYEVTRLVGRNRFSPAMRFVMAPGLALQSLTTREPDQRQVEVAIAALERVIQDDEGV